MNKTYVKKPLAVTIILLFLSVSVIPSTGTTDVKQITMPISNGDTLYVGGSGPNNYTKIQDAIDDAYYGDTVYVYDDSSPYYEHVDVDKPINLVGENRASTIIDGDGKNVVSISADGATISGFTIKNGNIGISLRGASNNIISENIITNNNKDGICISEYAYNNIISGNIISNNNYDGIVLVGHLNNYKQNISGNTVTRNTNGIYLGGSSENVISGNTIVSNDYDGIWLSMSHNNIISGNSIENHNEWGILLSFSSNNSISYNNFINNGYGHPVYGDAFFEMCRFTNRWKQNYWNKPRILPKPVFGIRMFGSIEDEFPIGLPWVYIDWRPASEPYDIEV